jgi:hypothetical protein
MLAQAELSRRARRFTSATRGPSEIALACRNVGLAFVNRVAGNPHQFIAWAIRDYQRVTCIDEALPYGGTLAGVPVEESALRETLEAARVAVLAELRGAALSQGHGRATFAELCIGRGLVAPSFNDLAVAPRRNERGWVPVDVPKAGIAERVLALFTVDYLWNPADYSAALFICSVCECVGFDARARERGSCDTHAA